MLRQDEAFRTDVHHSLVTRRARERRLRGGDAFAYHKRFDGSTFALIADASAKGALGNQHAEELREVFLRSVIGGLTPSEIVDELNTVRFAAPGISDAVFFASAFVASIDGEGTRLTYCSAGHELAFHFSGRAHAHLIPTGPVLGLFAHHPYAERTLVYDPRDLLVLATDGISEARARVPSAPQFGTYGIVTAFANHCFARSGVADAIMSACDAFCAGDYRDDATLAAIYLSSAPDSGRR